MTLRKAFFFVSSLALFAACGGSSFSGGGGEGGNAGSASGGSSSHAGSMSSSGKGGSTGIAGSKNVGGSAIAGSIGVGGTGGIDCTTVDCAYPACDDGQEPITKPGQCCPTCPPPLTGCEGVMCQDEECKAGYQPGRPEGACCDGCVPVPGMIACTEIACPPENHCPLGYAPGDTQGGCCYDCVPDPLFCNDAADCIIADKPRSCCGCPEAISMRQYQSDECWSSPSMPRMIPQECYPAAICDAVCGPCPPVGPVACKEHRCTQLPAP